MQKKAVNIKQLSDDILKHKKAYYQGKPFISDAEYDRLEDTLRELDPGHPVLQVVGGEIASDQSMKKIEHAAPMLSLAKTYDQADLESWMDKKSIVGTFKVDGNSLSLVYEQGKLVLAKTRGNGRVGEIVTDKVSWVSDCLRELPAKVDCEVRGEMYCSQEGFAKVHHEMLELGLEEPTNPRNIVAGILGRKKHIELARFFNFFAFEVLFAQGQGIAKESQKMVWLKKQGFTLPEYSLMHDFSQVLQFLEQAKEHMTEGDYGIDGAVFTFENLSIHADLGNTSHHPRYKMSFKWQGETAEVKINDITWATSRLGIVTPVAIIEPVYLSGATITNVTLHNALMVQELNLKAKDKIEIVRSGEVIPKLERVVESSKGKYQFPHGCPSCGQSLEFDDVRLRCLNSTGCPAQLSGKILNWIKCTDIEDISDKRLQNMIDLKLVESVADLYTLTVGDFLGLPSTKEKMATKLKENIAAKKQVPLPQFLNGLGISGMGYNSWSAIVDHYPDLSMIRNLKVEEIASLDGFAEKTANAVVDGIRCSSDLIDELLEVGVKPTVPIESKSSDKLTLDGYTIVITGALARPRSEIAKQIQKAGGKVTGSVSAKTSVLVTNEPDSGSSKAKKAKQLDIPIWSEDELFTRLAGA